MPISFDVRSTEIADSEVRLFKRLRTYCEGAAIAVVILAGTVLLGWVFGIAILKSVVPGLVTMKVNTALGLALSAISLWLLLPGASRTRRGHIARFLALLVVLIGLATLIEYTSGPNLRINELFISAPLGSHGTSSPGRPAPMTATAFVTLGMARLQLDWKTRGRPAARASAEFVGWLDRADGLL